MQTMKKQPKKWSTNKVKWISVLKFKLPVQTMKSKINKYKLWRC